MSTFNVPTREEVSANNQDIFDTLQKGLGFVPNLYAAMAHSENALGSFMQFSGAATSLTKKEKEAIDLAVSQLNECRYCQSAHTAIAKMNGFTDEQAIELRKGGASWDAKINTLTQTARSLVANHGKITAEETAAFYNAGYTKENLVDIIIAIGVITVTNYLHNATDVAIDFPIAPEL